MTTAHGPATTAATRTPPTTVLPTTSTTLTCRDSQDPACGDFRWDPDPGPNAPLVIQVTATPRANDPRTIDFAVVYTDADAGPVNCRFVKYSEEGEGSGGYNVEGGTAACPLALCARAYGPWTPPAPQPGQSQATVTRTYAAAGAYTVKFTANTASPSCNHPYASSAEKIVTVTVP